MSLSKNVTYEESIFFTDYNEYKKTIEESIAENLEYRLVKDKTNLLAEDIFRATALSIRDELVKKWLRTRKKIYDDHGRKLYYLSMEFLMGRLLGTSLINLGLFDKCKEVLERNGWDIDEILEYEHDMGLGNGGLGRLASCFLDSMATLELPAIGYGIRYQYGIFEQRIEHDEQIEKPDNWLKFGSPWELTRPDHSYKIRFYGKVESRLDSAGRIYMDWNSTSDVLALAYDIPIPGYQNEVVNSLRLWEAKAAKDFDLNQFNQGDYIRSVEGKNESENISKVLYPNDNTMQGKELRLKQQYFYVSASLQDIIRKHKTKNPNLENFHAKTVIQLNDTHPAIAIAELMRILVDEEGFSWQNAWNITSHTFAYTNHTVLDEALERWSVNLLGRLLPRHLQIIYEINQRFLDKVRMHYRNDLDKIRDMSLVSEGTEKTIKMAHLAVVGSFSINGVAELHTDILKKRLFKDFYDFMPEKFSNKTNGVTQRRWISKANPLLAELLTKKIGSDWINNLYKVKEIAQFADDEDFQLEWQKVKIENKNKLIKYIKETQNIELKADSLFDVQIKRIHEYKRQLLNLLHVITLYNRIKDNPEQVCGNRVVIFAGKAAPGYNLAKRIIHLINAVARVINNDSEIDGRLKVIFIPNYSVSLAELIIPASDLSEQISTAGLEASGTGNMKFMMNGAITMGTQDGANIEMIQEVGIENAYIFGLDADEIFNLKLNGYFPSQYIESNPEISRIIDMIENNYFSPIEFGIFDDIVEHLRTIDFYCLLADYPDYIEKQKLAETEFCNKKLWTKKSILNTANSGKFSTDRTILEYNKDIWKLNRIT
ncbi:MAG: glycogen/starch/alpha-glucan phosphorylase [bacterium]